MFILIRLTGCTRRVSSPGKENTMGRYRIALMLITYLALIILIIAGCTLVGDEEQPGVLRVMLTDAPLDWETVDAMRVTIRDVEISRSDGSWQSLDFVPKRVNLLELQNGVFTTLGVEELEAGIYEQLRLILDVSEPENNAIVFNDETVQPFTVPSGEQTGVKIIGPFEIEAGNTTSVQLDFDARSSVVELGNEDLILKPTITVLDTLVTEGLLLFFEDFGTGESANDIPNWDEIEYFEREDKCMVVEGSELGGQMARICGYDAFGTNHYFFKRIDLNGYEEKVLRLQARRSTGWSGADLVYIELFYDGTWHLGEKLNYRNVGTTFTGIEILLTEEMMETEFYLRFRNGIEDENEYLDIDNMEIIM